MIISYECNQLMAVDYDETRKIYLEKFNSLGKTKYNLITVLLKITHTFIMHKLSSVYKEI